MKHGFLFWVSLLFVSVVMASCVISSNCYALSYDDILDYVTRTADFFPNNTKYQQLKTYVARTDVKNVIEQVSSNYSNVSLRTYSQYGYNYVIIRFQQASNGIINSNSNGLSYTGTEAQLQGTLAGIPNIQYQNRSRVNESLDGGYSWSSTSNYENNLTGMSYVTQIIEGTLPNTFVGSQAMPQFTYLVFDNSLENTAYNGNLFTYYYQGDFYSNNVIKLGNIIPNDSYYFEIRLKDSKTEVIKGTSFVALNTSPYTFYNDGAIIINSNYEVYAIPRLLTYSNQYQLEVISYYGDGDNNLYEDIDWFIFLPNNAVVSGDVITSLGSGDFTQQDNTNTIIGFLNDNGLPSGDLQAILDTSGNILSGDLFKDIKMPQVDGMNRTTLFDLLYAIAGTIGEDGDAYFDFQLHGETPTRVYASQFRTPDGPLKTLISSFLVFFTFYFLLLQIRHALEMLSTANIKGTLEYVDASLDNMFYM